MKSEDWESAAEKALKEVLDADAVPSKPLEELVAACMAERRGAWSSFVEWLSAPRRAVAATVAGSIAITTILLLGVWCTAVMSPSSHEDNMYLPMRQFASSMSEEGVVGNGS